MSAILSCLENLPASCQFGLEGRIERLNEKTVKKYTVENKAEINSSWIENTLFGDLNRARGYYTNGFKRVYDIKAIPNLVGAALFSLATLPAQLLRTIWSVCCLIKAISPDHRKGVCDPLLENLSGLAMATMMATIATALTIFKVATCTFKDIYTACTKDTTPKKVLLIIDVQRDFENGGNLAVPHGDEVVAHINAFIERIKKDPNWLVYVSQDWHPIDHKSFAANNKLGVRPPAGLSTGNLNGIKQTFWPAHCVQGSKGAEIDPRLNLSSIPSDRLLVVQKGFNKHVDSYSSFQDNRNDGDTTKRDDTILNEHLKHANVTDVVVVGLATDFCDKYSALDAKKRKYNVSIIKEGCRGIISETPASGICEAAFTEMGKEGVTVVDTVDSYQF